LLVFETEQLPVIRTNIEHPPSSM
jgi:hypothetical protein